MDPAQGETGGKSLTSKLKAKVRGVKGKVHVPGRKKHGGGGNGNADRSDYSSSDDSPRGPGPETGYNLGESTPFTTVKTTPLSPERHKDAQHPRSAPPTRPATDSPRSTTPSLDNQTKQPNPTSTTEGMDSVTEPAPGILQQVKDTVAGSVTAVGSKMGYYNDIDGTPDVQPSRDSNAPSVMDKAKGTIGMDKPSDPNAPTLVEKTKATLGMDKPSDPNAPSVMEKAQATLGFGPAAQSPTSGSQPGIVERVSDAMSSLFTSSPKETGEDVQHTFPAHSDFVKPQATYSKTHGDYSCAEQMMPTTYAPAHNSTLNR